VHLVVDKFQYVYDGKLDAGLNNLCITRVLALQYIRISVSFFCDDRPPFELKNVKQLTRDSFLPALIGTRIHQADRWIYYDKATVRRRVPVEWPDFDRARRRIPRPIPAFVAAEKSCGRELNDVRTEAAAGTALR
jgi:hypothetical protein